ncbi:MAG: DnaB-like helicase C-terminal domain-containing protein [Dissulfurispiraceae bacterium]
MSNNLVTGLTLGFPKLDELTKGFQSGDLIVIGARPSMGKTALALNIVRHVALEVRKPVAIFSIEMSKDELVRMMLCAEAMVDYKKVRKGFLGKEEGDKIKSAKKRLADAPIFIDDSSRISALEMMAKAKRFKAEKGGLGLVIVDYLQLMRSGDSFKRREQEISEISQSLKRIAMELSVPVITLSQINKAVEERVNKRPTLLDLRQAGSTEKVADVIIFLYRDEYYNRSDTSNKGKTEVIVAKQKSGLTDNLLLTFLSQCGRFIPYS